MFPGPFLVRIKAFSTVFGPNKKVMSIHLQDYEEKLSSFDVKYLDIKGFSKFMWRRQFVYASIEISLGLIFGIFLGLSKVQN